MAPTIRRSRPCYHPPDPQPHGGRTMIERRRLGGSTLEVSALGLGCMSMSGAYGPGDDAQSIGVVHHALDLGVNFLDSSDMYGWGPNGTAPGPALPGGALPTVRELGISLVAYSPLGRSLLTGQVHKVADIPEDDRRRQHPRFEEKNLKANVELVKKVEQLAREKECTPGQLVLAWLLAQGRDIVPIPGTKRRERLEENVGAAAVHLSADEVQRISDAVPTGAASGLRYPEPQMKAVFI